MKVLITGGAGYIGSHTIIELLLNTDLEVISIDNYSTSSEQTYSRIEDITGKKIKYFDIDLKDYDKLYQSLKSITDIVGIIHFAAHKWVGDSVENPLKYYNNNIDGLINILQFQSKLKIPYFIFSSSCSVYGNIEQMPVNESSPLNKAESPYAATKQMGERIIEDFIIANDSLKAMSLRYFNPVGAHISGLNGEIQPIANNLLPYITQTAIGKLNKFDVYGNDYPTRDGTCIRDYIHVTDIANAHVLSLQKLINDNNFKKYDVINLGSGKGVSVLEVINAFEKENNIKLNYSIGKRREGDVVSIFSDSSKAKKILGWECKLGLRDMVISAWKWEQYLDKNNLY